MDNLLPTANPILQTPFEFCRPKYEYPGEIIPLPYFHNQYKPPKDILNFECCDIDFFQKEPTYYHTFNELHNNSILIYQRFIVPITKCNNNNFASPQYQGTQLYSKGPIYFNSNFECGNLYTVYKVADKKYNLLLNNDTQTNGCTRWYFFSVRTPERMMLQLNIINLSKQATHLSVNPYIYTSRTGWYRGGENVQYYKNHYQKKNDYYYTLSFSHLFEKDEVFYFSLYPPYGITTLQQLLKPIYTLPFVKLKALQINQGNQYPVLTIGDSNKPLIVILARQHPSEVVTSYVIEGVINYLVTEQGLKLREQFYFKILPMMNPDGVVHGNSRTNLQGIDINQKWHKVNKQVPSVQHVKGILKKTDKLYLVLDIHQTFKKYGLSLIGKNDNNNNNNNFIMALKQACPYFQLDQCKFGKSTKMDKTLPFALGDLLNVSCIYQVRISDQVESCKDFTTSMLKEVGEQLCKAINLSQNKYEQIKFNQYLDISASESCDSCDEISKKKLIKKRMISTNQGQENNLSMATSIITKKSLIPSKLKPLKPLQDLYQSNKKSTQPSQLSQFKTRIRSFSTRTPEFNLKH